MNIHIIESILHNNILEPIIRSIVKSSNIYLANVEPLYKHNRFTWRKNVNDNENVIETTWFIDFDGVDIDQHEHMINAYNDL
jgi:hypothetical protein